ncbi:MAG: DMT family transporter [Armatimonadota bacterium]|nr:DMT family transporter [Armatimonadota bacterium]
MRIDRQPRWIRLFGYAAALLSGVLMGLSWVVFKLELNSPHLGPADVNWLNMIGVAAIIWPLYLIRNRDNLFPPDKPYRWLGFFALIAATIFYLRNVGVDLCGATTAAIVSRVEAGFVFILSYIIVRQRVSAIGWFGSALLVAGALRTIGIGSAELSFDPVGVAALLGAALFIAVNAVIIKLQFSRVPNEMVILASATVQTIVFSIAVPTLVGLDGAVAVLHSPRLIGLVILGATAIATNLFLYYYAMKRAPMWAVRMLALVALPSAVIGDYLILHQPITMNAIQGMLLVMAGATMIILPGREPSGAEEEAAVPGAAGGDVDE